MASFLGMRGTGNWVTNQRPENFRDMILFLYPNGDAPLTAILAKMKSEKTDDPTFHWWTKGLPTQRVGITANEVYINSSMTTKYVRVTHQATYGIAGANLWIKTGNVDVTPLIAGQQVLLRDADRYDVDINAKVMAVVSAGANSYVQVRLLEADDNSATAASYNLTTIDTILVIGSINPEGNGRPEAVANDLTEYYNYTQIFRNSVSMTRTAMQTKLRTGDALKEARREAAEMHSIEMEKAFLFGVRTSGTGVNGKPERTTGGIFDFVRTNASTNMFDYATANVGSGKTWIQAGEQWLDESLEQIFRYGRREKLALCGSGALLGIQRLVKATGQFNFESTTVSYGIQVARWVTSFGTIFMKTHPLFSYESTNQKTMLVMEPENLRYRYVQDTVFHEDKSWKEGGNTGIDGLQEDYLTEAGLEFHHPTTFGILNNVGTDNA